MQLPAHLPQSINSISGLEMTHDLREDCAKQLDRTLSFFTRVETKASFLFAIDTSLLTLIALNLRQPDLGRWHVVVPGSLAVGLLLASLWYVYRCHFPKLDGGSGSLIYFAEISKRTEAAFATEWKAADSDVLMNAYLSQTWRNAQILTEKFNHVKTAFMLTGFSLLPWFAYLVATSIINSLPPVIRP